MSHNFFSFLSQNRDGVSPAETLDLVVGTDPEGWPVLRSFSVGDIMVAKSGNLYRVLGFSLDNTVFASPHGLEATDVAFVEFAPEGLSHPEPAERLMHREGLVAF